MKPPSDSRTTERDFARYLRLLLMAAALVGCSTIGGVQPVFAEEGMKLTIQSGTFTHGGAIPSRYSCEGQDISPPLSWSGVPANARSLVLIVDDPDAPDPKAPKMTWVHWVLYNIPAEATALPEDVGPDGLPAGTGQGVNDWKRTGYGGPCPPVGTHRYFFKLYALDARLEGLKNPTKKQVEAAMQPHVLASTELIGTYIKSK